MTYTYMTALSLPEQNTNPLYRLRPIKSTSMDIDEASITVSYSQAAPHFDDCSQLQQFVDNLPLRSIKQYQRIVDQGCGTADFSSTLEGPSKPQPFVRLGTPRNLSIRITGNLHPQQRFANCELHDQQTALQHQPIKHGCKTSKESAPAT